MKKKYNIFITDIAKNSSLEKKILGDSYNLKIISNKTFLEFTDEQFKKVDGILTGHTIDFDSFLLKKLKNCKIISRYGIGYNNIDINFAKKKNINVTVVPDYGVDEVSDHSLALILNLVRGINFNNNYLKGNLDVNGYFNYRNYLGINRLSNLNLAIIGLGRIGSSLALKCKNLKFNVGFYDPYINQGFEKTYGIRKFRNIYDLASWSNIVSLHTPLNKSTKNIINQKFIKKLKNNSILVNTARGGLFSHDLIYKAMKEKKIKSIGIDVFQNEPPLITDPLFKAWRKNEFPERIIFTPHSAFYSKESIVEMRTKAAKNIKSYIEDKSLNNSVNLNN